MKITEIDPTSTPILNEMGPDTSVAKLLVHVITSLWQGALYTNDDRLCVELLTAVRTLCQTLDDDLTDGAKERLLKLASDSLALCPDKEGEGQSR